MEAEAVLKAVTRVLKERVNRPPQIVYVLLNNGTCLYVDGAHITENGFLQFQLRGMLTTVVPPNAIQGVE
jgi:hypothetical protein